MKLEAAFGQILRKLRKENNLSQIELAKNSQLDRTFISMLERGVRQPSLSTLFSLSTELKCSPSEFIQKVELRMRHSRWLRNN